MFVVRILGNKRKLFIMANTEIMTNGKFVIEFAEIEK
jgi:hypothetical protein